MKKWVIGLFAGSSLVAPFAIGLALILVFGAALGGIMNMLQGGSGAVMTAAGYEELCQSEEGGTVPGVNSSGWSNPARGEITSPYGMRVHPVTGQYKLHDGTDVANSVGTPVYAASSGTVTVESVGAYGAHFVTITHAGGIQTQYGHMSASIVQNGDTVSAGQQIGEMGAEGWVTGPHLHFIVRVNGDTTDPDKFLKDKGVAIGKDDPTKPVGGDDGTQNVGDIGDIPGVPGQPINGPLTVSHGNIPDRTGDAGFASSVRALVSNQPDFVTLNEVGRHSTREVEGIAGGYSAYRDPNPDPGSGGQDMGNMVLWRSDTWSLVASGRVKIVEDDQAVFKGRKVKWDRFAMWAMLKRADGAVASIVSVHHMTNPAKFPAQWGNPPMSRADQYGKGMDTLLSLTSALEASGPVLVGGDMNSLPKYTDKSWSAVAKMGAAGYGWQNHGVDFIFFKKSQGIRLQSGRTVNIDSDHDGLTATMQMNGAGPGGDPGTGTTLPAEWTGQSSAGETVTLDRRQLEFAAAIAKKGQEMGVSDDGLIIAFMTVFPESKGTNAATAGRAFNNYASDVYPETIGKEYPEGAVGSDRDSVGLFQQRPQSGWGEPLELMDPSYAASAFFGGPQGPNGGSPMGLLDHTGWESRPKGEVAQDIQVSAHPDRYAAWETAATELLQVVKGADGGTLPIGNPNCPVGTGVTEGFTIGSFNVLGWGHTEPGGTKASWPSGAVRFPQAMNLLSTKGVSIAALQEMHSQNQKMFFQQYSQTWGSCRGAQDYVVWNKAEWSEVQCEPVQIPYFNGQKRDQPFVLLEQVSTGEKVWFMGIHNPANTHGNASHYRAQALQAEKAAIEAKISQGYPVFIAGDFNDGKDGQGRSQCVLTPLMTNAFGPSPSGCEPPPGGAHIDHIYSAGLTLVGAQVDNSPPAQQIADHPLVTAVIPSENSGGGDCAPTTTNPIETAGNYAPNAVEISRCMYGSFDDYISSIGGYRSGSISGNHETGCALDIMISNWATSAGRSGGDQIAQWIMDNREKLGVQYVIWRQRIWSSTQYAEGWRPMEDRGSDTANHMDHVHVSVFGPRCVIEV